MKKERENILLKKIELNALRKKYIVLEYSDDQLIPIITQLHEINTKLEQLNNLISSQEISEKKTVDSDNENSLCKNIGKIPGIFLLS